MNQEFVQRAESLFSAAADRFDEAVAVAAVVAAAAESYGVGVDG